MDILLIDIIINISCFGMSHAAVTEYESMMQLDTVQDV